MPNRRLVHPSSVSLCSAVGWIAFDSFDGLWPSVADTYTAALSPNPQIRDVSRLGKSLAAWEDLVAALREGRLKAFGSCKSSGSDSVEVTIPAEFWVEANWDWKDSAVSGEQRYSGISVQTRDLLTFWPLASSAEFIIESDRSVLGELQNASDHEVLFAITAVYDNAEKLGNKVPNINELPKFASEVLLGLGLKASGTRIKSLGGRPEYLDRRRKRGKTIFSERQRTSKPGAKS